MSASFPVQLKGGPFVYTKVLISIVQLEPGFHVTKFDSSNTAKYAQSKNMQAVFASALQSKYDKQPNTERLAFSFQPGLVQSNILESLSTTAFSFVGNLQQTFGLSARQGSATGVQLAVSDSSEVRRNGGRYFDRMQPRCHAVDRYSRERFERLWARWCADCEISWSM